MRAKTPTFIAEFQLRTTPADERALRIRLDAGRNIYNAALGEALRRLDLMRESKAYRAARAMKGKDRAAAFRDLRKRFGFSFYDLKPFVATCRNSCWIGDHLGSQEMQALTNRAIKTVEQYAYGKRGRPKFRGKAFFDSVENQTNASGLRFLGDRIEWCPRAGGKKLAIAIHEPDEYQTEALRNPVKHCRVLRREIRGQVRWYVQVLMKGIAPQRRVHGAGVVGIDIGPSNIAMVSDDDASFEQFCPTVIEPWKESRRLQRAMDRSRRATNPECFNANGTWKKGAKARVRSQHYQRVALKRRERERRLAAERKRSHGELANRVLGQGTSVKLEKLSYRSFQKCFGRSTKVRGAGSFVSILKNKISAADGDLIEINTFKTALSQFDHTTGEYVKKPLKQRTHHFGDGITPPVQRDLYSAFLARCCSSSDTLDRTEVERLWSGAGSLLGRVMSRESQLVSGNGFAIPPAINGRVAGRSSKVSKTRCKADDVVATARASESADNGDTKSPYEDGLIRHGNTQRTLGSWCLLFSYQIRRCSNLKSSGSFSPWPPAASQR
jgi:putative transposase